jgi:hypothetical protein
MGLGRIDDEVVTHRIAQVDDGPDDEIVHLGRPDLSRQHDFLVFPRDLNRIRSGEGVGAEQA